MESGRLRLPKRFTGFSLYPSHLAYSWLPHMFRRSDGSDGSGCPAPQPFQGVDIYDELVRRLVSDTLVKHVKSLSQRQEGGELERKCLDLMAVFQDGAADISQLGMDFTVVQMKRRSSTLEWNASNTTPLARFLRSVDRDIKEVLSWYFGGGAEVLMLVDLLYRNRPRPTVLWFAPVSSALEQLG